MKEIDIVFHLGSIISIPYSYVHPRDVIETNVMGTVNVLTAARENDVEKIVHTSTSEVYGTAQYVPIDEKHPLVGQSPYSASKTAADKVAESFHRSYGLPVTIIRPFNTYGPRQSARAVIPSIISQALVNQRILMGSLEPTRDYTFVTDTVMGFVRIAESERSIGEVINIGSNYEISIGELTNKIISLLGRGNYIEIDESRIRPENSEVERLRCNNEKAKKILNWKPNISLEKGLQETINYISAHIDSYKPTMYAI
jgi:dTDP-glucose 4,6-dehydratase